MHMNGLGLVGLFPDGNTPADHSWVLPPKLKEKTPLYLPLPWRLQLFWDLQIDLPHTRLPV